MNEEIKKNMEIRDGDLENITGGTDNSEHVICSDSEQIETSKQKKEFAIYQGLTSFCEK